MSRLTTPRLRCAMTASLVPAKLPMGNVTRAKVRLIARLMGKYDEFCIYIRFRLSHLSRRTRRTRKAIRTAPRFSPNMAPTIHAVRHAQGFHNLSAENHSMVDPRLTPYGEEQCRDLAKQFPYHNSVDLVVASALTRTINTALLGFGDDIKRTGTKIIAMPELQETSDLPCDTGSTPEILAKEMEGKPVDLSLVVDGWDSKKGKWSPDSKAVEARARDARRWLMARPEKNIVVVAHGAFLHYFTEDWTGSDKFTGTGWANTEYRSFTFSTHEPENAHLVETAESRRHRGEDKPLDREEKANKQIVAEEDSKKQSSIQTSPDQASSKQPTAIDVKA